MHRPALRATSCTEAGGDVPSREAVTIGVALIAVTAEDRRHTRRQVMAPDLMLARDGHEQRLLLHESPSGSTASSQGLALHTKETGIGTLNMIHAALLCAMALWHLLVAEWNSGPESGVYLGIKGKIPGRIQQLR